MNNRPALFLTIAAGGICGLIFVLLKVPNGLRIGALLGSALLGIFFRAAWMPSQAKYVVQMIAGCLIGCSIEKSDLRQLPRLIKPTAIMLGAFLVLNLSAGFLISALGPLSRITAFMCAVPGGVTDTPIIAADMGADTPKVALAQLARYFLGVGFFPPMIIACDNFLERFKQKNNAGNDLNAEADTAGKQEKEKTGSGAWPKRAWSLVCTLAMGAAGGILGIITNIPAGCFLFSVVSVLVLKLVFDFAFVPAWVKKITLIISGCYIGSLMTMDDLLGFRQLALPIIFILAAYILNCFVTGWILHKSCGLPPKEAMLCTTPAGATDIALCTADMGIKNTDIVIIQVFRAIIAISVFLQIINVLR
jgi:membrane AbrB-like protein